MEARVTGPQKYFAKMPYMACRGATANMSAPRTGQRLTPGVSIDVQFDGKRTRLFEFFTQDSRDFVIPEDGTYHVHFQASVWASSARASGDNIYAYINVTGGTGAGVTGNTAAVIQQHVRSGWYQTVQVSCTEYFTKGSKVRASMYLDSGASGDWCIADGDVDTGFYAFMVAPNSGGWQEPSPGQAPELKPWSDDQYVTPQDMNAQTVAQNRAVENPSRVTARNVTFTLPAQPASRNAVSWGGCFNNSNGNTAWFGPGSIGSGWGNNTSLKVPFDGIYLVSVLGQARHLDAPIADVQYAFQIAVHKDLDGKPILLGQSGNPRKAQESGLLVSDVIRLKKGDDLNVRFFGYGPTNADNKWDQGRTDGRWWNLAITYLGRGTYRA
ncbi:hypothetical protein ACIQ6V_15575 [Streptomyces sp. NPDC096198]|uniref:hypothetical protein n=1 Tax=Streptomyces sp. NPDC096198 TaxID=3366080 RepID=UPI0037FA6811